MDKYSRGIHWKWKELEEIDMKYARTCYVFTKEHKWAKLTAEVLSTSVDEALWFPLPFVALLLAYLVGDTAEIIQVKTAFAVELFSDIACLACIETVLKTLFHRERPFDRRRIGAFYCLYGEWWSFPSGHTMRAFYIFGAVSGSRYEPLWGEVNDFAILGIVLLWAITAGLSRVSLGKHYPLDVLAAAFLGLLLSVIAESLGFYYWGFIKLLAGIYLTVGAGAVIWYSSLRREIRGYYIHLIIQFVWWVTLPFCKGPTGLQQWITG